MDYNTMNKLLFKKSTPKKTQQNPIIKQTLPNFLKKINAANI